MDGLRLRVLTAAIAITGIAGLFLLILTITSHREPGYFAGVVLFALLELYLIRLAQQESLREFSRPHRVSGDVIDLSDPRPPQW